MKQFKNYLNESASMTTVLQESLHCVGLGITQLTGKNVSKEELLNGDMFTKSYDKYCRVDVAVGTLFEFA